MLSEISDTFHGVVLVLPVSSLNSLLTMISLNKGTCLNLAQQNVWFIAKDKGEMRM